ncbi:MAG: bifunctional hydroxymethylpyrimidine kinase/phosphomethylpyrimidine kinase, partial [Desulfurococcaceae archaeon]
MKIIPTALTIAGSDSGGGAGIQADLKTFAVMGVHGMSAITSITAQNTKEVRAIHDIPPEIVVAQIEAVVDDIGVDAAKTGMLSNSSIVNAVAKTIEKYGLPLVVDPVIVAKSGARLLREEAVKELLKSLIPLAKVVTPNRFEAEVLSNTKVINLNDVKKAAQIIVEDYGCEAAIVKGGHVEGEYSIDVMYYRGAFYEFKAPRIMTKNTHGTGCSFSAAIAAGIAKGKDLVDAVKTAKELVTMSIEYSLELGGGHGPVNPIAYIMIPAERYRVLNEVEAAIAYLSNNGELVSEVVPEVGMNIGMAIEFPYVKSPLDVAAVPGRISRYKNTILVPGKPEYGVSRHIATAILTAMSFDNRIRASANIAYSKNIE